MTTTDKHLRVGDVVIVRGYEQHGPRRVAELYDQAKIPGGVKLDEPVDLFRSWNEDELRRMTDKTTREPCGNEDCDLCYPMTRWKATRVTIWRKTDHGEVKAATVEEARALVADDAWKWGTGLHEVVERQSPMIEPLDQESLDWHAENDAAWCLHAVRERVAVQPERHPRPVTCEWCGNRFRSIIPYEQEGKQTQGDDCAASVYQKDGEWYVAGHYGSGHFDMDRLRFVASRPTAPLDPVCDQCITERIAVGDLVRDPVER